MGTVLPPASAPQPPAPAGTGVKGSLGNLGLGELSFSRAYYNAVGRFYKHPSPAPGETSLAEAVTQLFLRTEKLWAGLCPQGAATQL